MAKKKTPTDQQEESPPKFEEGLAELQTIVQQLETGQLGLDEALDKYQRGIEVLKQCHSVLKTTERKIELLSGVDAEGNPVTQAFEDEEMSLDEKAESRAKRRGTSKKSGVKSTPDNVDDERKLF
ncbi:exodeoxyribonuclease VII small subunit [Blastopirellula marina]|uniref:Exodeoxyribonuclease 7 small subunit n=1 Tax=Blastopirellula marina TaxID=124 RepID=A0A2S8G9A5_9BACT|nr:exodeoxyribonuclease VII small subunit [Blastopirellula marina]PQO41007.1 exodeoxyribonuclease VII small subunit [Blastopirellula marina]PTL45889.1 exodeoxyribonuclease VII small subunit [Blastopirellula marina]